MKKRKISFLIVFLVLCTVQLQAQWDLPFSQHWKVKTFYNPSFAGETDKIQTAGLYKLQWTNVKNAPTRLLITADSPVEFFGLRHGVGLVVYSENIENNIRNTLYAVQYTYKQKLWKGYINAGVQAGLYDLKFDPHSYTLPPDSTSGGGQSSLLVNPTTQKTFDLNAGISWTSKNVYLGVSASHVLEPNYYSINDTIAQQIEHGNHISGDSTRAHIPRTYYFTGGCNIKVPGTLFHLQPLVWVQTDLKNITNVQATLLIDYNNRFALGAAWRNRDGYSFIAGISIQGVELGYAYDLYTSGIGKLSKGNHEISFRYRFPFELFAKKNQPYKSIRLL